MTRWSSALEGPLSGRPGRRAGREPAAHRALPRPGERRAGELAGRLGDAAVHSGRRRQGDPMTAAAAAAACGRLAVAYRLWAMPSSPPHSSTADGDLVARAAAATSARSADSTIATARCSTRWRTGSWAARRRRGSGAGGVRAGLARRAPVRGRPWLGRGVAHDDRAEPRARSGAGPEPAATGSPRPRPPRGPTRRPPWASSAPIRRRARSRRAAAPGAAGAGDAEPARSARRSSWRTSRGCRSRRSPSGCRSRSAR